MNIEQFRKEFDPLLTAFIRERVERTKSWFTDDMSKDILDHLLTMFASKGKRVRPYAIYLGYISAGGNSKLKDIVHACIASELQHAFALIHDDVIDRDDVRHSVSTVHKFVGDKLTEEYGLTGLSEQLRHLANSQAILAGDLVLGWSYEAIHKQASDYSDDVITQFELMLNKVIAGEMMDVSFPVRADVTDIEINQRDVLKTAADTFVYPTLMGVTLAGRKDEFEEFCIDFGVLMGEVFQIQDDILDITGEKGAQQYSDITEHQHTVLTHYVMSNGSDSDKIVLNRFFSADENDIDNEDEVLTLLSNPKVIDSAILKSRMKIGEAKEILVNSGLSEEGISLWTGLLEFFENRFPGSKGE